MKRKESESKIKSPKKNGITTNVVTNSPEKKNSSFKSTSNSTTNGSSEIISNSKKEEIINEKLLNKEQELKLLEEELQRKSRSIDYILENLSKREQQLDDREKDLEKRGNSKTPRGNKTPRGGTGGPGNKTPRTELPSTMKPVQVPSLTGKMDQVYNNNRTASLSTNHSKDVRKQTSFFNAFNFFKTIENTPREENKIQPRNSNLKK